MKKVFFLTVLLSLFAVRYTLYAKTALAVCPVCTVAVGAGLGLSRWLGVDDTISGIWIGGLILSSSLWFIDWLKKKYPKLTFKYLPISLIVITYLLVFGPLVLSNVIGHPFSRLWGIDKLVVGTLVGSAAFWLAVWLDRKVRETRSKQLFNYQKIIFPVGLLAFFSLIMYLITK